MSDKTSGGAIVRGAPWQDPTARPYVQIDRVSVLATKARLSLLERQLFG
ncbi:MAG: hypothetical protein ABSG18_13770 [Steroidobacteraceae bacterium]|jgi:hypothetical protein